MIRRKVYEFSDICKKNVGSWIDFCWKMKTFAKISAFHYTSNVLIL
jgi:hypothetical protein